MQDEAKNVPHVTDIELSYQSVFQNIMVGQILVSENLNLVAANNRMFEYFCIRPCKVMGSLFGCAFHCSNCDAGQICGQNPKCADCRIRSAVNDILENRIVIKDAVVQFTAKSGNRRKVKWFQISGAKLPDTPYVIFSFSDITVLKLQEEHLRKRLALDLATGTMNKYSLMETIQKMIGPERGEDGFTVCMIDFDNFKEVNDQFGHLIGDKVLEAFSNIARKHIRKRDILHFLLQASRLISGQASIRPVPLMYLLL